jgi:hypothetical protein
VYGIFVLIKVTEWRPWVAEIRALTEDTVNDWRNDDSFPII